MLCYHKKSKYNLYEQLDYLGLNSYEQKYFCFHGSTDGDESGDTSGADAGQTGDIDIDALSTDAPGKTAEAAAQDVSMGEFDPGATYGSPFDPDMPEFTGWGFPDVPDTSTGVVDSLKKLKEKGYKKRAQDLLDMRFFSPDLLGIPQMNTLEEEGFKTFGLGYRGDYEARSPTGLSRQSYDPNSLTGAGTDQASTNKSLFAQFARANPNLTTVEAVSQYNATSPQEQQVSISDVQSMGFDLNAPVGPQATFREAEAQRGFAQGMGLVAQTIASGSPIGALTDIAMSGRGKGYGKGVVGHMADMFEEATGIDLPEAPDIGIPSYEEMAVGLLGPEQDTMAPGSFGITGVTEESLGPEAFGLADISTPTDEEVGYVGYEDFNDYSRLYRQPRPTPQPQPLEVAVAEETPAIPFNLGRETTPPSRVSRIANIYGIDEDAAKRMLGIV
jgi:hypothetical protein